MVLVLALGGALAAGGCSKRDERVYFNGNHYPTKERAEKGDDRRSFVVTVRRVDQGLEGAREAGRHGGTRYCLENFGTSDISWTQGPDAEDGVLQLEGGNLVLRGQCVLW